MNRILIISSTMLVVLLHAIYNNHQSAKGPLIDLIGGILPHGIPYDTWGWTREYAGDHDGQVGRIVYLQPGETNDRTLSQPAYRQVIKHTVIWSANQGQLPAGNPNSPLGTNLGLVTDFSTQLPFVDAFKMARPWIPNCVNTGPNPDPDCVIEVDENGWVTALSTPEDEPILTSVTTFLLLGDAGGLNHVGGEYIVLYEGEGTIEYGIGASKDEAASIPGRDVVNVSANGFVRLRITETDPNQTGDYIRNIRFIRPEYEETYETQPFNPVFLNKLANFSVLRFMPWMRTNDEPPGEWAERPQVDDYTYTTTDGVPLEIMLDLANQTQASPWFNMPHTATDEYMTEFATMVRDNLNVTAQAIVEYSNETWNGAISPGPLG